MATLTRAYSETNGAIGQASSVNRVIDDLYSTINAVGSGNLALSGITNSAISLDVYFHRIVFS